MPFLSHFTRLGLHHDRGIRKGDNFNFNCLECGSRDPRETIINWQRVGFRLSLSLHCWAISFIEPLLLVCKLEVSDVFFSSVCEQLCGGAAWLYFYVPIQFKRTFAFSLTADLPIFEFSL